MDCQGRSERECLLAAVEGALVGSLVCVHTHVLAWRRQFELANRAKKLLTCVKVMASENNLLQISQTNGRSPVFDVFCEGQIRSVEALETDELTSVSLQMSHHLLSLSKATSSSLSVAGSLAPFPLALVACLTATNVIKTKMRHEVGTGVEGEGTSLPTTVVSAARGRLRPCSGSGGARCARMDAVRMRMMRMPAMTMGMSVRMRLVGVRVRVRVQMRGVGVGDSRQGRGESLSDTRIELREVFLKQVLKSGGGSGELVGRLVAARPARRVMVRRGKGGRRRLS